MICFFTNAQKNNCAPHATQYDFMDAIHPLFILQEDNNFIHSLRITNNYCV